jgi:hypothetical protein
VNVWPTFDADIITRTSFPDMVGNYALSQLNDNNLIILQLDSAPVHFTHASPDYLNVNVPRLWLGRGWPTVWPLHTPSDSLLWRHVKGELLSLHVNTLDELKTWTTAAVANVIKDMLQYILQKVDYTWGAMQTYRWHPL